MDAESIKHYLSLLGCRKIRVTGKQVYSTCPNEAEHKKGRDTRPGFTVKVDPRGKSPSFCPSCKIVDSLEWIVFKRLGDHEPLRKSESGDISDPNEFLNARIWGRLKQDETNVVFPDELYVPFSRAVPKYAVVRGIELETCRAWGLGHDRRNHRLMFAVRQHKNKLRGVCGRSTRSDHPVKYTNYAWDKKNNRLVPFVDYRREEDFVRFEKSKYLYGENMLNRGTKEILIVEGQIDALMVWQRGVNVVAIFGSYVSIEQVAKLVSILPSNGEYICLLDSDNAGVTGAMRVKKLLASRVPVRFGVCPEGMDPGDIGLTTDRLSEIIRTAGMTIDQ